MSEDQSNSSSVAQSVIKKNKKNPLFWVLGISGGLLFGFMVLSAVILAIPHKQQSKIFKTPPSIGVIEVNGVIMDSKKLVKQIQKFEDNQNIKAVVIRINSPGGAVAPSQEVYEAIKKMTKPTVSSMSSVAASGGYYLAVGTKKIFANPGTITGSIGVIMQFANLEKLYDWAKVKRFSIKTGRYKDTGAEFREMADDEKALIQTMVDDVLSQFKAAVQEGRKLSAEKVTQVADGRIFSGSQAKKLNLIDELGTFDDAIAYAGKVGGISGKPKVVYPEKPSRKILDMLINGGGGDDDEMDDMGESRSPFRGLSSLVSGITGVSRSVNQITMEPGIYWLWSSTH